MSISANYPTVAPSLNLDFANSQQLDPRITFSRPTTATYYDANTTALAEQNLFTYTEQFDNAIWVKSSLVFVTANSTTAPDGQTTADTLTSNTATVNSGLYQAATTVIGNTFSVYAKAGTSNFVGLTTSFSNATPWANFNLSTGVVSSSSGCTASIVSVGNGWYRCIMANTTVAGQSFCYVIGKDADPAGNPWNNGTWTSGNNIYIWGAQLEQRSSVTAYNATTTTAITNYIPVLLSAPANQARFDHNPTTRESLGLLIEQQSTNLLTYSSGFDNAIWGKYTSGSIIADYAVAPDGTLTADQFSLVTGASAIQGFNYGAIVTTATQTYTMTIYVKPLDSQMFFALCNVDGLSTSYNLTTLAVTSGEGGTSTGTITAVGNGWYRLTRTVSDTATGGARYPIFTAIPSYPRTGGPLTWTPTSPSRTLIWGAQLEATAFPTSYIPTVASQVTRSADSASMTGTNFSSWYNNQQGTLYLEADVLTTASGVFPFSIAIDDNTNNNRIEFYGLANNAVAVAISSIAPVFSSINVLTGTVVANTPFKIAQSFANNNRSAAGNGVLAATQTSGNIPYRVFQLQVKQPTNAHFRRLTYYPVAVTSAQLQSLTGS